MGITYQTTNRLRRKVMTAPLGQPPVPPVASQATSAKRQKARFWLSLAAFGLGAVSLCAWLAR